MLNHISTRVGIPSVSQALRTLVLDAVTGKSKGFGFVIIAKFETAKKAATETHGRVVNGQKIKVKLLD